MTNQSGAAKNPLEEIGTFYGLKQVDTVRSYQGSI